jgi:hypothetical protein
MKKKLYYSMPFIIIPLLMLTCEWLDNSDILNMSPYILGAVLLIASVAFGFFSPADGKFDYLITVLTPLSLFCFMFVCGFLSKSDMETRFHLHIAVDAAFQPVALVLYFLMEAITFLVSFKRLKRFRG